MMNIIIEFIGGPMDGQTVAGRSGQQDEADRYYALTHHGRIGQRFRIASTLAIETLSREELRDEAPHHFQPHSYKVTDRVESEGELLIRVEYVDQDAPGNTLSGAAANTPATDPQSAAQLLAESVQDTARSISESLSHCWPKDEDNSIGRNVALYFGHALLSQNFSVVVGAPHEDEHQQPVDLLAIAPGQDWFLAGDFFRLQGADAAQSLQDHIAKLTSFWLSPKLTIEPCRLHLVGLAEHCAGGYALLTGWHWLPDGTEDSEPLACWQGGTTSHSSWSGCRESLDALQARWLKPILLHQDASGQHLLMPVWFRIPRPAAEGKSSDSV